MILVVLNNIKKIIIIGKGVLKLRLRDASFGIYTSYICGAKYKGVELWQMQIFRYF